MTQRLSLMVLIFFLSGCGHEDHDHDHDHESANNSVVETDFVQEIDGLTLTLVPANSTLKPGANDFLFTLEWADPTDVSEFGVDAWMPAHGHGTDVPTVVEPTSEGYVATITFSMPGDWDIRVNANDRDFVFQVRVAK